MGLNFIQIVHNTATLVHDPPTEYSSKYLVYYGSSISLIIHVLLNMWYLVLLLYVMYTSAEHKREKRGCTRTL